jgi:hypothetical protein
VTQKVASQVSSNELVFKAGEGHWVQALDVDIIFPAPFIWVEINYGRFQQTWLALLHGLFSNSLPHVFHFAT